MDLIFPLLPSHLKLSAPMTSLSFSLPPMYFHGLLPPPPPSILIIFYVLFTAWLLLIFRFFFQKENTKQ